MVELVTNNSCAVACKQKAPIEDAFCLLWRRNTSVFRHLQKYSRGSQILRALRRRAPQSLVNPERSEGLPKYRKAPLVRGSSYFGGDGAKKLEPLRNVYFGEL